MKLSLETKLIGGICFGAGVANGFCDAREVPFQGNSRYALTYGPTIVFGTLPTIAFGVFLTHKNAQLPKNERVADSKILSLTGKAGLANIGASAFLTGFGYFTGYLTGIFTK